MDNIRVGLSICVAGVATTNKVGHYYSKKVWHCPVLVKVGHIRRPKMDSQLKQTHQSTPLFQAARKGLLQLKGI